MCQGLLSCRRHIGKREDPGDEVGSITDYGEDPPKRGTFFMLQVFEKVGISLVEDREAKQFVISVNKKAQKG